jgi:hypothetical protein
MSKLEPQKLIMVKYDSPENKRTKKKKEQKPKKEKLIIEVNKKRLIEPRKS